MSEPVAADQLEVGMVIGYLFRGVENREVITDIKITRSNVQVTFESGRVKKFAKTVGFIVYDEPITQAHSIHRI
jgi:hypothetical protein